MTVLSAPKPEMTQKSEKPELDDQTCKDIEGALKELIQMEITNPAAVEVASDNLASLLRRWLFAGKSHFFSRRTPSLYDLVEGMNKVYDLDEDTLDAAYELRTALEDSYIETNELSRENAVTSRDAVIQGIKNFLQR
jgi:hypothetical protein